MDAETSFGATNGVYWKGTGSAYPYESCIGTSKQLKSAAESGGGWHNAVCKSWSMTGYIG